MAAYSSDDEDASSGIRTRASATGVDSARFGHLGPASSASGGAPQNVAGVVNPLRRVPDERPSGASALGADDLQLSPRTLETKLADFAALENRSVRLLQLPDELWLLVSHHLDGMELMLLRRVCRRLQQFWVNFAFDNFRAQLMPLTQVWSRRELIASASAITQLGRQPQAAVASVSSGAVEARERQGQSRTRRLAAAASRFLRRGIFIPSVARLNGAARQEDDPADSPHHVRGLVQSCANDGRTRAVEEQETATSAALAMTLASPGTMLRRQVENVDLGGGTSTVRDHDDDGDGAASAGGDAVNDGDSAAQPGGSGPVTVAAAATSPPEREVVAAHDSSRSMRSQQAFQVDFSTAPQLTPAQRRRVYRRWMREMGRYWMCRRNISLGLCNFTAMERHSHAVPALLPNGTVIFSRWQMLSCFVRFEKYHGPPATSSSKRSSSTSDAQQPTSSSSASSQCEGDPATSKWGRTGHIASHRDTITVIRYHAPSETVITGSLDATIKVWKPRSVQEAPAWATGGGRPRATCRRHSVDDSSADEDAADDELLEKPEGRGDSQSLPYTVDEPDPEAPVPPPNADPTWLTCISTFDVPSAALTVPRYGVYSVDTMEVEDYYGERSLAPLMIIGMESGHIVLVSCQPDGWQVVGVNFTGDIRALQIKFVNKIPFAAAHLRARKAAYDNGERPTKNSSAAAGGASSSSPLENRRSRPDTEDFNLQSGIALDGSNAPADDDAPSPPSSESPALEAGDAAITGITAVEGQLSSSPLDAYHPYRIRMLTDAEIQSTKPDFGGDAVDMVGDADDTASQGSVEAQQAAARQRGARRASMSFLLDDDHPPSCSPLDAFMSNAPSSPTDTAAVFVENGTVHVAVVTMSTVMLVEFHVKRRIELFPFYASQDTMPDLSRQQRRVVHFCRTDGISGGLYAPPRVPVERVAADPRCRVSRYLMAACDVGHISRVFGMAISDSVSLDMPPLCHSSQLPVWSVAAVDPRLAQRRRQLAALHAVTRRLRRIGIGASSDAFIAPRPEVDPEDQPAVQPPSRVATPIPPQRDNADPLVEVRVVNSGADMSLGGDPRPANDDGDTAAVADPEGDALANDAATTGPRNAPAVMPASGNQQREEDEAFDPAADEADATAQENNEANLPGALLNRGRTRWDPSEVGSDGGRPGGRRQNAVSVREPSEPSTAGATVRSRMRVEEMITDSEDSDSDAQVVSSPPLLHRGGEPQTRATATSATCFRHHSKKVVPWHGNPFFMNPCLSIVNGSEGRLYLLVKALARDADYPEPGARPNRAYVLDALAPQRSTSFTCCRFSPTSGLFACGFDDGALRLYLRHSCVPSWAGGVADADSADSFGSPVYETDALVAHIAQRVRLRFRSSLGDDGLSSVKLAPAHKAPVSSVHIDDWKLSSVDTLSTVHVTDLRSLSLLWVVSQRPRPWAMPASATLRDQAVTLDSLSHTYIVRQVTWLNETMLVSPLGITKHAFVAHFGGRFRRADPRPQQTMDVAGSVGPGQDGGASAQQRSASMRRRRFLDRLRMLAAGSDARPRSDQPGGGVPASTVAPSELRSRQLRVPVTIDASQGLAHLAAEDTAAAAASGSPASDSGPLAGFSPAAATMDQEEFEMALVSRTKRFADRPLPDDLLDDTLWDVADSAQTVGTKASSVVVEVDRSQGAGTAASAAGDADVRTSPRSLEGNTSVDLELMSAASDRFDRTPSEAATDPSRAAARTSPGMMSADRRLDQQQQQQQQAGSSRHDNGAAVGRLIRVVHAEPHGLISHALHIVGFPMTITAVLLFALLVALRIDELIGTLSWWVILLPHVVMWPHYAALDSLAFNHRMLQHSGLSFHLRLAVDALYVILFPVLYVCRSEGYAGAALESVSWVFICLPLSFAVIMNCVSLVAERARDARLMLQASDTTPGTRFIASLTDVSVAASHLWLINLSASYFDTPPTDESYWLATDFSSSNLSIFLVTMPLWIGVGIIVALLPRMQFFARHHVTPATVALLIAAYIGVIVLLLAPLTMFCLKYNNYYAHMHWSPMDGGVTTAPTTAPVGTLAPTPTTTSMTTAVATTLAAALMNATTTTVPPMPPPSSRPEMSTNSFIADVPLTLIIAPILIVLVVADVHAVNNVINHYQRLMRGVTRRTRAALGN